MKRQLLLSLRVLCVMLTACGGHHRHDSGPGASAAAPVPSLPPESATADLIQLEQLRAQSVSEGDAFALESLMDSDFRDLSAEGERRNKTQLLQKLRQSAVAARMKETLDADELDVRLFGDFAVVMGRSVVEGARYHAERFTHVWRWQVDRWMLVSAHASPAR